jgi:hypothetical protein
VALNQTLELPELQLQRKVKSMQMFRKPVKAARQGDRVGICVTNLDPTLIERGIATSVPSPMVLATTLVCLVRKVRFFKQQCKSGSLFHVSIGHQTVTATAHFFGREELAKRLPPGAGEEEGAAKGPAGAVVTSGLHQTSFPDLEFDWESDYEYQEELIAGTFQRDDEAMASASAGALSFDYQESQSPLQWMSLALQAPVYCTLGSLIIASKLDTADGPSSGHSNPTDAAQQAAGGASSTACRLAFYGPIKTIVAAEHGSKTAERPAVRLRLYRWKQRECEVQRLIDCRGGSGVDSSDGVCYEAIAWRLYHKNASIKPFLGLKLMNEAGEAVGVISGPFGSSDKFRVKFPFGVPESSVAVGAKLFLRTKRYVFEKSKALLQNGIEIEGVADLRAGEAMGERGTDERKEDHKKERSKEADPPRHASPLPLPVPLASLPLPLPVPLASPPPAETSTAPLKLELSATAPVPTTKSPSVSALASPPSAPSLTDSSSSGVASVPPSPSAPSYNVAPIQLASIGVKKTLPPKRPAPPPATPRPKTPLLVDPPSPLKSAPQVTPPPVSVTLPNSCTGPIRVGTIESVKVADSSLSDSDLVAVVAGCFRMEENIRLFVGQALSSSSVSAPDGSLIPAQLLGPFAKLGKCKIQFPAAPSLRVEEMIGAKVEIRLLSLPSPLPSPEPTAPLL